MENTIFQDYRIFNYIYNNNDPKNKKAKELNKKKEETESERVHPAIKYPKTSKIETFKNSLKFKEEDSQLYVNKRKSDSIRQEHKKKKEKQISTDTQHVNMLNNIMF